MNFEETNRFCERKPSAVGSKSLAMAKDTEKAPERLGQFLGAWHTNGRVASVLTFFV